MSLKSERKGIMEYNNIISRLKEKKAAEWIFLRRAKCFGCSVKWREFQYVAKHMYKM